VDAPVQRPLLISLKQPLAIAEEARGRLRLSSPHASFDLDDSTPGLSHALKTLVGGECTEDELAGAVLRSDGVEGLARLYFYLHKFKQIGILCFTVATESGPLLTVEPLVPGFRLQEQGAPLDPERRFVLSRFAYCRRRDPTLAIESPLSKARVLLRGQQGATLLAELATGRSCWELAETVPALDNLAVSQSFALLAESGLICELRADGSAAEDEDAALLQWEFHDLLFHARSRSGRHDSPSGATYRFQDRIPPSSPVKAAMSEDAIPLFRPALDQVTDSDRSLTRSLEERVSVREQSQQPITAEQIGEFLFRVARVRSVIEPGGSNRRPYAITSRPYPGSGAVYELEVYLNVQACEGIEPGLYHYDPSGHQLFKVSGPTAETAALVRSACRSSGITRPPQLLITLTARFQRLSWKYESIAYASALKDVGVLYQTMYLVATAMGLAPCALGSGDSDLFSKAAGLLYLEEPSIGEFMLGSRL
jgi:SagB-type dehydrogenase family enzyme